MEENEKWGLLPYWRFFKWWESLEMRRTVRISTYIYIRRNGGRILLLWFLTFWPHRVKRWTQGKISGVEWRPVMPEFGVEVAFGGGKQRASIKSTKIGKGVLSKDGIIFFWHSGLRFSTSIENWDFGPHAFRPQPIVQGLRLRRSHSFDIQKCYLYARPLLPLQGFFF